MPNILSSTLHMTDPTKLRVETLHVDHPGNPVDYVQAIVGELAIIATRAAAYALRDQLAEHLAATAATPYPHIRAENGCVLDNAGCEQADRALIAAAPELLAALKALVTRVPLDDVSEARAAIAKAEGRDQ